VLLKKLIIGGLWPSHDVDPKDLETDIVPTQDVNLAEYIARVLRGDPSTFVLNKDGNEVSIRSAAP
jgi:hypothetical protein